MGKCVYCGEGAGFLKKAHKECARRNAEGKAEIVTLITTAGSQEEDLGALERTITRVATDSHIDTEALQTLVVAGWEQAVVQAFEDGIVTEEEEVALRRLKQHFALQEQALDRKGAYTKLVKGAVIRELLMGSLPNRQQIDDVLPFNLQKAEQLVWVFQEVDYYEEKMRTRYVGGSQGLSLRVAKGLYYRTGAFNAERVQSSETIHADTGLLGVTNKHVYFAGRAKRFRIAYSKIVTFEPFADGIGVQRDAQTARPQTFVTGDGWFTYNLITNLARV